MVQKINKEHDNQELIINTRFGELTFDLANSFELSPSLMGFPLSKNFCLCDYPSSKFQNFKIMQSLDEHNLSIITLPFALHNSIHSEEDVSLALSQLGFSDQSTIMLLIISVMRMPNQSPSISANMRAPIMIDAFSKKGAQYIFGNKNYSSQHIISN